MSRVIVKDRQVPRWRGLSHELALAPAAILGSLAVTAADGALATFALAVHVASLILLLATSSIYHRHCRDDRVRRLARRADHAAIFILIAGTYTPIALFVAPRWLGYPVLGAAWLVAAYGAGLKLRHLELGQDRFHSWMYAALASGAVVLIPWMIVNLGWPRFALVLLGGTTYAVGGIVLISKKPDPYPDVFGFHEIWHLGVLIAAALHLVVSASLAGSL